VHARQPEQSHLARWFPSAVSSQTAPTPPTVPDADAVRRRFEHGAPSFGIEEEVMVLDPVTLALAPRAAELLGALGDSAELKLELPASQLEIVTAPSASLGGLEEQLGRGRARLAQLVGEEAALASAGVHPFARGEGSLNTGGRYDVLAERYGSVARRQLVCALHVHIAIDGPERALAVYNAMREHLPELAALAANAPVYEGRDTGMASVRPLISGLLPRQGIPPPFASFEEMVRALAWMASSGLAVSLGEWWWELRLHPGFGTVEVRVADAQACVADAAALAAATAGLALWLAARHDAGELPPPAPGWQIAENRWSAARKGLAGTIVDLRSAKAVPTAERVALLLEEVEPFVAALAGEGQLAHARTLLEKGGGAAARREAFLGGGAVEVARELAAAFLPGGPGEHPRFRGSAAG
jgi:glutamate---cysteine ligase / carboxylate-amine ligase